MVRAASLLLLLVAGCAGAPVPGEEDAGLDSGPSPDGGVALDAGEALDADADDGGDPMDAEVLDADLADASASDDAGAPDDASSDGGSIDGGSIDGGSIDGGSIDGGALDAGPSDAGLDAGALDAGPVTTCTISITPSSGSVSSSFVVTTASNGTGCSLRVDGGPTAPFACSMMSSLAGSLVGPGDHLVELLVADGPAGATSCSTRVMVTDLPDGGPVDASPSRCEISVAPDPSTTADTLALLWSSDGTTCTVSVDGSAPIGAPCTGMFDTPASGFTPGAHTLTLSVDGARTCTTSFTVDPAPDAGVPDAGTTTTCAIDVTPPTGGLADTFVATWSSNGTGCTLRVTGTDVSIPCSFSATSTGSGFGAGTHVVELVVAAGPGGPTSCSQMVVVTP